VSADAAERRGEDSVARILVRPAVPSDASLLLELFTELAEYEQITHELTATADQVSESLFGESPAAEALIAMRGEDVAGYALYFTTFSSFRAKEGVWLEDLFVRPPHRRAGVGRALLAAVAARVRERDGARLEWSALDWNELALSFYRGLGARTMNEWITHRLDGDPLAALARESSPLRS
jgi:GNAT superfamily N-acetyltransferase